MLLLRLGVVQVMRRESSGADSGPDESARLVYSTSDAACSIAPVCASTKAGTLNLGPATLSTLSTITVQDEACVPELFFSEHRKQSMSRSIR